MYKVSEFIGFCGFTVQGHLKKPAAFYVSTSAGS